VTDTQPTDDALREQYAAAIRPTMLIGLQGAELDGRGGTQRINEWADWIATAVAAVRDKDVEALRDALGAVERVRDLHQAWDADPGSCAHCHDSYGSPLRYPCPTALALDQAQQPAGE
jgi:hypothetical protein